MGSLEKVKIEILSPIAVVPSRGSDSAAGYDLFAALEENVDIAPRETKQIPIGIALEIPEGFFGAIYARSGLATTQGLRPANCVAIIDSDYRGEISVPIHNDSPLPRVVFPRERVAQIVIQPHLSIEFVEEELSDTKRGKKGFGSTGGF